MLAKRWTPILNYRVLGPCPSISKLVSNRIRPVPGTTKDKAWTVQAIFPELDMAPAIEDELLESVVAIWRLREVQEESWDDLSWHDHLEAWLIRHRDLCRSANIPPFQVIVQFLEAVKTMKLLPESRIPSFEPLRVAPSTPPINPDAPPVDDLPMKNITVDDETEIMIGQGKEMPATPVEYDFTHMTIDEGTSIDETDFPLAKNMVCIRCAELGKLDCHPLWSFSNGPTVIRCQTCTIDQQPCSFTDYDWGFAGWPKIKRGDGRRDAAATAKHKSKQRDLTDERTKANSEGPTESHPTRNVLPSARHGSHIHRATAAVSTTTTANDPGSSGVGPSEGPAPDRDIDPWVSVPGRNKVLFFEDFSRYENTLRSSKRSVGSLRAVLESLKQVRDREMSNVANVRQIVELRRSRIDALEARFDSEVLRAFSARVAGGSCQQSDADVPGGSDGYGEISERGENRDDA